jgi:hypothetical protein
LEKKVAQSGEVATEDLLRQAAEMIEVSQRERQRIEATMPRPSDEWQQESEHLAETAQSRETTEAEVVEVALASANRG